MKVTVLILGLVVASLALGGARSGKEPCSVICVAAAPTPSVGSTPGAASSAPVYLNLNGVSIGDAPAPVLARLGLHPPGWARTAPSGTLPTGEVRQFQADSGNATMMLFFDEAIEVVMVQMVANKTSSITDPYGIKLNDPLDHLVEVRGKADKVEDKSIQQAPDKSDTMDHLTVWRGLHDPIESDFTYIYGQDDGIRWEYAIKGNQVISIRVVDCRIAGMCTGAKGR